MPTYKAPISDFQFILNEYLNISQYKEVEGFADSGPDLMNPLLEAAAQMCEEVLFPLNSVGDKQGLRYENGKVIMPDGFAEAYKTYCEMGWPGFTCDPKFGGQGLPDVLNMPLMEMVCSANLSFGLTPGLSHGAYNAIMQHASDEIKQKYLPNMVTGKWSGVMCLTEPQAGTDLGLIRSRATPNDDGSYSLEGNKIFISSGEHEMCENIVHLILARLPDAPKGIKGISLFIASKYDINPDGSIGKPSGIRCDGIEHKMGLAASPTCQISFNGCKAWLVGEAHKGMRAMFTMMNAARLYVGVQGLGIAEIAYQNALNYSKERLQMRALTGAAMPDKPADPITVHPDVRRMLLTQRAFCEGARALAMEMALNIDLAHRHPDEKKRQEADDFVQLMTPVCKSYLTDGGFEMSNLALQCFGGYGYIKEYGVEQYVRDARITMIYEGTNGIQALDLIGRKLSKDAGKYLRSFFHPADKFIEKHKDNEEMKEFVKPLKKYLEYLQQATLYMAKSGLANPNDAAAGAVDYQRQFALTYMAYIWARQAEIALARRDQGSGIRDQEFYTAKLATARFFMNKILPQASAHLQIIVSGSKSVMNGVL